VPAEPTAPAASRRAHQNLTFALTLTCARSPPDE
jgi:hypothetical protein